MNSFSELVEALNLKTEFDEVFSEIPFEGQIRLHYKSLTPQSADFFQRWGTESVSLNTNKHLTDISEKYLVLSKKIKKNYNKVMKVKDKECE